MIKELSDGVTETQEIVTGENKLWQCMVWERYCYASPKPEFFLFSLFIFSFISQLIYESVLVEIFTDDFPYRNKETDVQ